VDPADRGGCLLWAALTTWAWAQLEAGSYGLPGPAVVSSWVLTARVSRLRRLGFTRVTSSAGWSRVREARSVVADYPDPWDLLVVGAPKPDTVDGDGLRQMDPAAYSSGGGVQWWTGTVFGGPTVQAFHDRVHAAGRLLLLTGDFAAYSSARHAGSPATFKELFSGGSWAAWVPLSVHLYDDGAGTRPD